MILLLQILILILSGIITLRNWTKKYIIGCLIFNFAALLTVDCIYLPYFYDFGYLYYLIGKALIVTAFSFFVMNVINRQIKERETLEKALKSKKIFCSLSSVFGLILLLDFYCFPYVNIHRVKADKIPIFIIDGWYMNDGGTRQVLGLSYEIIILSRIMSENKYLTGYKIRYSKWVPFRDNIEEEKSQIVTVEY